MNATKKIRRRMVRSRIDAVKQMKKKLELLGQDRNILEVLKSIGGGVQRERMQILIGNVWR